MSGTREVAVPRLALRTDYVVRGQLECYVVILDYLEDKRKSDKITVVMGIWRQ